MSIRILYTTALISLFLNVLKGQSVSDYNWKNVPIGGGGYVTGMKIHPLDADLRIYRTDIGGAYKFNPDTERLDQIVFSTEKSHYSVAGIAMHPTNTQIIYLAVGRYCKASTSAIFESTDGGESFSELVVTGDTDFYFAGNGGRNCTGNNEDKDRQGTPIDINPNNPNELYIGTTDNGLFVLDLTTLVCEQIDQTEIPHNTNRKSIRSVVFHPNEPLVYIAYADEGVFMGNTNTKEFSLINGSDAAKDAIDISLSKDADYLVVACKRKGVLKCSDVINGTSWTQLSSGLTVDFSNEPNNEGYLTVDCSPHDNNKIITVSADWNHINEFHVSENAGLTWSRRDGSVPVENNAFPWRSETFASHVAQIAYDPVDESTLHYTSWFSTYQTNDFSFTNGGTWGNLQAKGHEEIVPTDLIAFPTNMAGHMLISGSADHSGFIFDDDIVQIDSFATQDISDKTTDDLGQLKKSASYAFCEKQSDHLALVITNEWDATQGGLLTSIDGGDSWNLKPGYITNDARSLVEMSSNDPQNLIIYNANGLKYTKDGADTDFISASGTTMNSPDCTLPFTVNCLESTDVNTGNFNLSVFGAGRNIAADKELPCVFYYYDWNGKFSISTNGGEDWCVVHNDLSALPAISVNNDGDFDIWNKTRLITIPDHAGHIWINISNDLYFSDDAGASWTNISDTKPIDKVKSLTFGKGVTAAYPSLFVFGTLDGENVDHYFRSDDQGDTWIKINDHAEKELWTDTKVLAGDRNVAGRLYASVSGQGVVFGDDAGLSESCATVELVQNGGFDSPSSNIPDFNLHDSGTGMATGIVNDQGEAFIDISNGGEFIYSVQMWQDDLAMLTGTSYVLTTRARADADKDIVIKLRNRANGSIIYHETTLSLTTEDQVFTHYFVAPNSDADLRLTHLLGTNDVSVYFDEISFKEVSASDSDYDGICDEFDQCPGFDDTLIGTACDDGDSCTTGEIYDSNCGCSGGTSDWTQAEANTIASMSIVVNPPVIASEQDIVNVTYVLYNAGTDPLVNIAVTPDESYYSGLPYDSDVNLIFSGDPNNNGQLDPGEVWFYTSTKTYTYEIGDIFILAAGVSAQGVCGEEIGGSANLLFTYIN